jgi:hypothetical protein
VPFKITNDGSLSIYDVVVSCHIHKISAAQIEMHNVTVRFPTVPTLGSDASMTERCRWDSGIRVPEPVAYKAIDISFDVRFWALWLTPRPHIDRRFVGALSTDGQWTWQEQPPLTTPYANPLQDALERSR